MSHPPSPWARFWFAPADPFGLHAVRVATGLMLLFWLLTLAADADALFGLNGWFDRQAYLDASRGPTDLARPISWSVFFPCGENPVAIRAVFWGGVAAVTLFTLGLLPRLTGVLTWVLTVSLTANPVYDDDVEALFRLLTFYLAVGYALAGPWADASWFERLFGSWRTFLFARRQGEARPSMGVNLALRLIQVHLAILLVTAGLHKLQSSAWWSGVAHWYFLVPPFEATPGKVQQLATSGQTTMALLNLAAYATLAWQLTFPIFAWRIGWWRVVLIGGALAGWAGLVYVYRVPLFGPALLTACLAYLDDSEWQRIRTWSSRFVALLGTKPGGVPAAAGVGGR